MPLRAVDVHLLRERKRVAARRGAQHGDRVGSEPDILAIQVPLNYGRISLSQHGRAGARSTVGCAGGRSSSRVELPAWRSAQVKMMPDQRSRYIGLVVHRATIAVALAE